MFSNKERGEGPKNAMATILAAGTKFTGHIQSQYDLRIDGEVIGDITCQSKVVVGVEGRVAGNIICRQADVLGHLHGDLEASDLVNLRSGALLHGDLRTRVLQIEQGVVFNGRCHMEEVPAEVPEEKARSGAKALANVR